jgi:hypothetical protein
MQRVVPLLMGVLVLTAGGERALDLAAPAATAGEGVMSNASAGAQEPQDELRFAVPPGYVQQRNGEIVVLAPATPNERTPCVYGVAPARRGTGNLETDAERALLEAVVPGWRRLDDRHSAMRGTAAGGWPYVWYRAAFEGEINGERQFVNAMAMVLPAAQGRVHVVWGMGSISRCLCDDATFELLFHSLQPTAWTSDRGRALAGSLIGTWRYTASAGLQQLSFRPDGRFGRDLGSRTHVGVQETTATTVGDGRYVLQDNELHLVPDHRPQSPDRYRVRVYDDWFQGGWKRMLVLLDSRSDPPLVVPYFRVEESR